MVTFMLKKLVRDKTIERHKMFGITPTYEILKPEELKMALRAKVVEEAIEVAESTDHEEMVRELADLYEVVKALCLKYNVSFDEVKQMQETIAQERGSFEKGIYVEKITMPEDNEWVKYFRSAPDKYQES